MKPLRWIRTFHLGDWLVWLPNDHERSWEMDKCQQNMNLRRKTKTTTGQIIEVGTELIIDLITQRNRLLRHFGGYLEQWTAGEKKSLEKLLPKRLCDWSGRSGQSRPPDRVRHGLVSRTIAAESMAAGCGATAEPCRDSCRGTHRRREHSGLRESPSPRGVRSKEEGQPEQGT